jgi:hypothetical protein
MNIYEEKWQKFLSRTWPFQYIPFIDFVFAAGSLATGNMREESDFDVVVGVRKGRIFTVRFLCFLIFKPLGWWATHPDNAKDKICFNHFVTPNAYRLSPPHNEYWKKLYLSLVPIYGDPHIIQKFYRANAGWLGEARLYQEDYKHKYKKSGKIKKILEWVLSDRLASNIRSGTRLGDRLEQVLRKVQIRRIEKSLKSQPGYKPRIIYSDDELEFHPDTKRIGDFLQK